MPVFEKLGRCQDDNSHTRTKERETKSIKGQYQYQYIPEASCDATGFSAFAVTL